MPRTRKPVPLNAEKSFFRDYLFPRAWFLTVGIRKGMFGSVDITNRCQLRCRHCYFYEDEPPEELPDEGWLDLLRRISSGPRGVRSMTWVGGEPLLRGDLIEKARKFFSHNMIVTNGLSPLPDWPDVAFHVSLDGDEEAHELQRNRKGIYQRTMKNVDRPDLDVTIAYCISSLNLHCVEKVLEEWRPLGTQGFLFSFYTPIGSIEDPLFPGWEARDRILDRLIELKKTTYGDYIRNELVVLELMKSRNSKSVTDRCQFHSKGVSLDSHGEKKAKCMMGDRADCDRCGCIVPYYLHYRSDRRKLAAEMFNDLTAFLSSRARHLFRSGSARG